VNERTDPHDDWLAVKRHLVECLETENAEWEGIDDLLIARYVAGTCSEGERQRVESAVARHPRVRECVQLLQELQPPPAPDPAPMRRNWLARPAVCWGLAACCLFLTAVVYWTEEGRLHRRVQQLAAAYAGAPRQFYGDWMSGVSAGKDYDYRYYCFKSDAGTAKYARHVVIRPKGSDYFYYYNPESKKIWGRFVAQGPDAGKYSVLAAEDRREHLYDIPPGRFPTPGPMPEIPGASDGTRMHSPADYPERVPADLLPSLRNN
jgi:hypothetical protein